MTVSAGNSRSHGAARFGHSGWTVDTDLHGVVTIRVLGGRGEDLVPRTPGLSGTPVRGAVPDIVVQVVDHIQLSGPVRRLGSHASADDDGLILHRPGRGRVRLRFPIVPRCEVMCERPLGEMPLLLPIVRAVALSKGVLSFHATAFVDAGRGVVATGWSGSGKTFALLAAMAHGASAVAAECVLVDPGSGDLLGIRQPIRIKPSHVERWPALRDLVPRAELRRLRRREVVCRTVVRAGNELAGRRATERVGSLLERRLHVDVDAPAAVGAPAAPFDALFLLEAADVDGIMGQPLAPEAAAIRLTQLFEHDLAELLTCYRLARYADPGVVDEQMEALGARYAELVRRHLTGRRTSVVRFRQPVELRPLYGAMTGALAR